ncbi:MAG: cytochrome c oxidase subunit II [Pseudomonadota bacterium]
MFTKRSHALRALAGLAAGLGFSNPAMADWELNMPRGVTPLSAEMYDLHMLIFWICVIIAVLVFGAMIYSIVKFRRSTGAEAESWYHSTKAEIIWTVIPILILVGMAVPAAESLVRIEDTRASDISIKVTGYQWKWHYEYLDEGIEFFSSLDAASNEARQLDSGIDPSTIPNYLREVDNRVVVPVGKKVRILLTANDVIHAWWVPELGGKRDAIPGFVNEMWFRADEVGTYRGQCAELCGRDHGFMPIVVDVVSEPEYTAWASNMRDGVMFASTDAAPVAAAPAEPAPSMQDDMPASADDAAEAVVATVASLDMDSLMANGEKEYQIQCGACHQANGKGMPPAFPALVGSEVVNGPVADQLNIVLNGRAGTAMLGFGDRLSDEQIASIITYTRNAWEQSSGETIQPADVRAAR